MGWWWVVGAPTPGETRRYAGGKEKETEKEVLVEKTPAGGTEGTRTLDFLLAKQTLYRLSYSPI